MSKNKEKVSWFDMFLILITGGLWYLWVLVRTTKARFKRQDLKKTLDDIAGVTLQSLL